jgi:galactokinase
MRDDFEITVSKGDALVEDAVKMGALGARQTGGGFGGCIVACIAKDKLEAWRADLLKAHTEAFWVA